MNENPYQPPETHFVYANENPLWKLVAKVVIAIYGVAFTALSLYGYFPLSLEPTWYGVLWQLTSIGLDAVSCYGIFALAFRAIRHPSLYPLLRVFAWIFPVNAFGSIWWELSKPDISSSDGGLFLIIFVAIVAVVVTAPAILFNFLLVGRLRSQYEQLHNLRTIPFDDQSTI